MERRFTGRSQTTLLAGALAVLLAILFCLTAWGQAWERFVLDTLFLVRGALPAPSEVVVVAIDEPSMAVIGKQWPWPRSLHAQLIDRLFASGARIVAIDILFAEPSVAVEDSRLSEAIRRTTNLILAADRHLVAEKRYTEEMIVKPLDTLSSPATRIGLIDLPVDPDGFVRRMEVVAEEPVPFALVAADAYCASGECARAERGAGSTVWTDRIINFYGPPRTIRTVSYYQALEPASHLPPQLFNNKLVFVGFVTRSTLSITGGGKEQHAVPFSRWGYGFMSGVEIHAHAAANTIHGTWISQVSVIPMALLGFFAGIGFCMLFFRVRLLLGGMLLVIALVVISVAGCVLFSHYFIYAPLLVVLMPITCAYLVSPFVHYVETWREKNFIRKAFASYLAPAVVDRLLGDPSLLRLGGRSVEATVLVADLADFTALSEQMAPESLLDLLNRFLGRFAEIVFRHEGLVDKYIGDEVMAVWGMPVPQPDHAQKACQAALDMRAALEELALAEKEASGIRVRARIGINSGTMIAGNVGTSRHFNYTVVGRSVNHAFRLEGANKVYGTTIIIGEETASIVAAGFELRELDRVRVMGEERPARIYELQALKGTLSEIRASVNRLFGAGLDLYRKGEWAEARKAFEEAFRLDSRDGPSLAYSKRCLLFEEEPPGADWEGVFSMPTK